MRDQDIITTLAVAQTALHDGDRHKAHDLVRRAVEGLSKPAWPDYQPIEQDAAAANLDALPDPAPGWEHDGYVFTKGEPIRAKTGYMTAATGRHVFHVPYDLPADGGEMRVRRKLTIRKLPIKTNAFGTREARDGVWHPIQDFISRDDFIAFEYSDGEWRPYTTLPGRPVQRAVYVLLEGGDE